MKKIKFYVAASFVALAMMMSSCMGDTNNTESNTWFGVVEPLGAYGNNVLYWVDGAYPIYNSSLSSIISTPSYVYATYTIDYDDPNNADPASKNYYVGSVGIISELEAINARYSYITEEEIEKSLEREGVFSAIGLQYWVKNTLFVAFSVPQLPKDSKIEPYIQFGEEPTEETDNSGNKIRVYNVYIKANVDKTESSTVSTVDYLYAIPFRGGLYSSIESYEKNSSNNSFGLRFNYIKEIDEETGEITWGNAMSTSSSTDNYLLIYSGDN